MNPPFRFRCIPIVCAAIFIPVFAVSPVRSDPQDQSIGWLLNYEPYLFRQAVRSGIWPGMGPVEGEESSTALARRAQQAYTLSDIINPYFQHGDFDHDGLGDVALVVTERHTGRQGFAIIPGNLETVHLVAVGPAQPADREWKFTGWNVEWSEPGYQPGRERVLVQMRSGEVAAFEGPGGTFGTYLVSRSDRVDLEPDLVSRARNSQLWPAGIRYEILWEVNPAYLRGDFDGDGLLDVIVLVRDTSNREKGIVIIPGTLDSLHAIFPGTAGPGQHGIMNPFRIQLVPKGETLVPFSETGPSQPIVLTADAVWAGWPGAPYSGAWYFKEGRYIWVTLSD